MAVQCLSSSVFGQVTDRRIYKSLKYGMFKAEKGQSMTDSFKQLKACGFDGVELGTPGINIAEAVKARDEAGLVIDGTVISSHWSIRHSDPNPEVRAKALDDLKKAIRETHAVGGSSVLLVVGHGKDGAEQEVWNRSVENIRKALPLAAWYGMTIAVENVWNHFLYEHGGPSDQSADKLVKYIDEFDSPWVGVHYDIGNHWKYSQPADWIRTLGHRIVKLDVKGFSRKNDKFTKIGEGDLPWAEVRQALADIEYTGWAAAEVGGGGLDRMREVAGNLDKHLLGL